jgi:hypothetical protein
MRLRGVVCAVALLGCGSSGSSHGFGADASTLSGESPDAGSLFGDDAPSFGEGGTPSNAAVYGESYDTLYRLDPVTKAVAAVGAFSGCAYVTDIALDKDSNMFATTLDGLYRVDRATAACTKLASGTYPNSLSFVPIGTLDPNTEVLVGYNQPDAYVRIDPQSGAVTKIGSIGLGYTSSGDIVSIKGGGTFLTVKDGPGACNDCLIEVDPKTGSFVKSWGPLGHKDVYGIAFWAGAVYGFDARGELFEVDFTGAATQVTLLPIPIAPPNLSFQGAGSTTIAPLTPLR